MFCTYLKVRQHVVTAVKKRFYFVVCNELTCNIVTAHSFVSSYETSLSVSLSVASQRTTMYQVITTSVLN